MFHVEQRLSIMNIRILLLSILCLFALGCKSENPNPELLDPIYSDLKKEAEEAEKGLEEAKKELQQAKGQIDKADPNSIELKDAEKAYWKADEKIKKLEVSTQYLRIRTERRRVEGRKAYRDAFKEGREWPDPSEYSGYLTNKRLRAASLNWNTRVPKLEQRGIASEAPKKPESSNSEE